MHSKIYLGGTIKEMMEAEMDDHLGYEKSSVQTVMIIVMATNPNVLTAAMAAWISMFLRIVSQPLNLRL